MPGGTTSPKIAAGRESRSRRPRAQSPRRVSKHCEVVRRSFEIETYEPRAGSGADDAYGRLLQMIGR